MINYKTVQKEALEAVSIQCNRCGVVVNLNTVGNPNFTEIRMSYGYGSDKDGDKYISHVCEPCMDGFYKSFKVPPQVRDRLLLREEE